MALIKPFRLWIVYPALMRQMEKEYVLPVLARSPIGLRSSLVAPEEATPRYGP